MLRGKKTSIHLMFIVLLTVLGLFISSCAKEGAIDLGETIAAQNQAAQNYSISKVELINGKVEIHGTNLSLVQYFEIEYGGSRRILQTESHTNSKWVGFNHQFPAINLVMGSVYNIFANTATGATVVPIQVTLATDSVDGTHIQSNSVGSDELNFPTASNGDVLTFDGANWNPAAPSGGGGGGTYYRGTGLSGSGSVIADGEYIHLNVGALVNQIVAWDNNPNPQLVVPHENSLVINWDDAKAPDGGILNFVNHTGGVTDREFHMYNDNETLTIRDGTASAVRMTIDSTGDVAIQQDLDVVGGITQNGTAVCLSNGTNCPAGSADDHSLDGQGGGPTDVVYVHNGGNVGIGTTNPSYTVSINGDTPKQLGMEANSFADTAGSNFTVSAGNASTDAIDKTGGNLILQAGQSYGTATSSIDFRTSTSGVAGNNANPPSTKMRLTGNGALGIGTTSPAANLHVHSPGSPVSYVHLTDSVTGSTLSDGLTVGYNSAGLIYNREATNLHFGTSDQLRMSITGAGDVAIGGAVTTPNSRLEVIGGEARIGGAGAVSQTDFVRIEHNGTNGIIDSVGAGSSLDIEIDGTRAGTVTSVGFMGMTHGFAIEEFGSTTHRYVLKRGSPNNEQDSSHLMLTNRQMGGDVIIGTNDGTAGGEMEAIRIENTSGYVGVGESNPNNKFEIRGDGTTNATNSVLVKDSAATMNFQIADDGVINTRSMSFTNNEIRNTAANGAGLRLNTFGEISVLGSSGGKGYISSETNGLTLQMRGAISSQTGRGVFEVRNKDFGSQFSASSGQQIFMDLNQTMNQTGTAGYKMFGIDVTETTTGSGEKLLIDTTVGGTRQFAVTNNGQIHAFELCDEAGANCNDISAGFGGGDNMGNHTATTDIIMGTNVMSSVGSLNFDIDSNNDEGNRAFRITNNGGSNELARISEDGRLGIGEVLPLTAIDVVAPNAAQMRIANTTTDATLKNLYIQARPYTNAEEDVLALLSNSNLTTNILYLGGGSGALNAMTELRFYTAANATTLTGTQRMTLDSAGNLGIGDAAPGALLTVRQSVNPTGVESIVRLGTSTADGNGHAIAFNTDSTIGGFVEGARIGGYRAAAGAHGGLVLETRNAGGLAERMRIDQDGNVGVGTNSPSEKFHISAPGASGSQTIHIDADNDNGLDTSHAQLLMTGDGGTTGGRIQLDNGANIFKIQYKSGAGYYTGMELDYQGGGVLDRNFLGAGNVGIGTSGPDAKLAIDVATATDHGLKIQSTDDSTVNNLAEFWDSSSRRGFVRRDGYLQMQYLAGLSYVTSPVVRSSASSIDTTLSLQGGDSANRWENSSGVSDNIIITPDIQQSGTAGYRGLLMNVTETSTGSGIKELLTLQVGGADRMKVLNDGKILAYEICDETGASCNDLTGGLGGGDNLGNHTATAAVQLNDNWLSNDGGAEGLSVSDTGLVGVGINPAVSKFEIRDSTANFRVGMTLRPGAAFEDFSISALNDGNNGGLLLNTNGGQPVYTYVRPIRIYDGTNAITTNFDGASLPSYIGVAGSEVGIQTASPTYALEVNRAGDNTNMVQMSGSDAATGNTLRVYRNRASTNTNSALVDLINDAATDDQPLLRIQQDAPADIMNVFDGATEVFTILDGGNVGINQINPAAALEVNTSVGTPNLEMNIPAGQTVNALNVIDSSANNVVIIDRFGQVFARNSLDVRVLPGDAVDVLTTNSGGDSVLVQPRLVGDHGLVVKGLAGQTETIFEVQNSANTELMSVSNSGWTKIGDQGGAATGFLHVAGNVNNSASDPYASSEEWLLLQNANTTNGRFIPIEFNLNSGEYAVMSAHSDAADAADMRFGFRTTASTNYFEAMRITTSDQVWIDTLCDESGGNCNDVSAGFGAGDNMGDHTATQDLSMTGFRIESNSFHFFDIDTDNNDADTQYFNFTKNNGASILMRIEEDGDVGIGLGTANDKLDVAGVDNNFHVDSTGLANNSVTEAPFFEADGNEVTLSIGSPDNFSGSGPNDSSGNIRFLGASVAWGDLGYYPTGGDAGENGHFRFSITGSIIDSTPDAKVGVGQLYSAGSIGVNTTSPSGMVEVEAATASSTGLVIQTTDNNTTNDLTMWQNSGGTGLAVVDATGRLGVGETSPDAKIAVDGATATDTLMKLQSTDDNWTNNVFEVWGSAALSTSIRSDGFVTTPYGAATSYWASPIYKSNTTGSETTLALWGGSPTNTVTSSSGIQTAVSIPLTVNQSGTAGYKALNVNVTETGTGSGIKELMALQVGGADRMKVLNDGKILAYELCDESGSNCSDLSVGEGSFWDDATGGINYAGGNVGIGITTPAVKLHLHEASPGSSYTHYTNTNSGTLGTDGMSVGYNGSSAYVWNRENTQLFFGTNNATRMTILGGGNVGIGETSPIAVLHVAEPAAGTTMRLESNTGETYSFDVDSTGITISEDGTGVPELFIEKTTGEIGIGTATPGERLHVMGEVRANRFEDSDVNYFLDPANSVSSILAGSVTLGQTGAGPSRLSVRGAGATSATSSLDIADSGGNSMLRVLDDGAVGFGIAAPAREFQFHDPGDANVAMHITHSTTGATNTDGIYFGYTDRAWLWNYEATSLEFGTSGTTQMTIDSAGDVGIGVNTPTWDLEVSTTDAMTGGWNQNLRLDAPHPGIEFHANAGVNDSAFIHYDGASSTSGLVFAVNGTHNDLNSADSVMKIMNGGNVGIGTTSPTSGQKLEIQTSGGTAPLYLNATGTSEHMRFNVKGAPTGASEGDLYANSNGVVYYRSNTAWAAMNSAADYSELILPKDSPLWGHDGAGRYEGEIGLSEIITINENGYYELCNTPYDDRIAGIESGNRGLYYLPEGSPEREDEGQRQVGIVGHVKLKVSIENGKIDPGDFITCSTKAGVGMKATRSGRIAGIAKESFDAEGIGLIEVYVNPHTWLPTDYSLEQFFSKVDSNIEMYNIMKGEIEILKEDVENLKREVASLKEENEDLKSEVKDLKTYLCLKDPNAPFCNKD